MELGGRVGKWWTLALDILKHNERTINTIETDKNLQISTKNPESGPGPIPTDRHERETASKEARVPFSSLNFSVILVKCSISADESLLDSPLIKNLKSRDCFL